ncbi:hypothetical protein CEXT_764541 [Caerostris extrusa]|uniref:Uncharacterized protein n=1 Tax=Caerostris extrusa TaxID=172846 RepID=A0AAV4T1Z7_CAEEX|nr:hypothetical protein CEXT_764541 [Caerostris extrusa]
MPPKKAFRFPSYGYKWDGFPSPKKACFPPYDIRNLDLSPHFQEAQVFPHVMLLSNVDSPHPMPPKKKAFMFSTPCCFQNNGWVVPITPQKELQFPHMILRAGLSSPPQKLSARFSKSNGQQKTRPTPEGHVPLSRAIPVDHHETNGNEKSSERPNCDPTDTIPPSSSSTTRHNPESMEPLFPTLSLYQNNPAHLISTT